MINSFSKYIFNTEKIILFLLANPISLLCYVFGIKFSGSLPIRPFFSLYVFLSVALIALFIIKKTTGEKVYKIKLKYFLFYLMIVLFMIFFNSIFSQEYRSFVDSLYEIANIIIPLSIAYLSRNSPIYVIHSIIYLTFLNIAYIFFQFIGAFPSDFGETNTIISSGGSINPVFYRFSGIFTSSVSSSFLFALVILICIYYREFIPKFISKNLLLIISSILLIYTYSRVSFIFLIFIFLLKEIIKKKRNKINIILNSLFLTISIFLYNSPLLRLKSIFSISRNTTELDIFDPYDINAPRFLRIIHFFESHFDRLPLIGPYENQYLTFSFFPDVLQKFGILFGLLFIALILLLLFYAIKTKQTFTSVFLISTFITFQATNGIINAAFYFPTFFFYLLSGWLLLNTNFNNILKEKN
ncbi:MAG: hypothetical protein JJ848_000335 [Prochlorococcus marinus CUG1439]|uniref:hypothetical protein n=1 Tax=Prochlorococcus sp. MIT 1314 TaxID=3096220 RepID=UPI001B1E1591|nr:hypothetical protein [Prochlorococcus sp. MIT 1314]MCR8538788.1 hypothetical protein [Prochlorococcus marinus CUG1439]